MSLESVDLVALIDDSDIDLFVQKRFIEISSFARNILVFKSARKALDHLAIPSHPRPNVIFLDLNMPDMDGFSFLEEMLKFPVGGDGHPKVVILTSSSSSSDKARAATFGNVISFLSKPLTEKRLVELKPLVGKAS